MQLATVGRKQVPLSFRIAQQHPNGAYSVDICAINRCVLQGENPDAPVEENPHLKCAKAADGSYINLVTVTQNDMNKLIQKSLSPSGELNAFVLGKQTVIAARCDLSYNAQRRAIEVNYDSASYLGEPYTEKLHKTSLSVSKDARDNAIQARRSKSKSNQVQQSATFGNLKIPQGVKLAGSQAVNYSTQTSFDGSFDNNSFDSELSF